MTREEAKEILTHNWTRVDNPNYSESELDEAFFMAIEALSADRPTGMWINREKCQVDEDAYEVATCSECRAEITIEYPYDSYCPNCGVKMKRENYE
jgi:predicted RNA-binding Zn-ribbon protein involved in translation (DUF1610 family)